MQENTNPQQYKMHASILLKAFLFFALLFGVGRLAFYIKHAHVSLVHRHLGWVLHSFVMGFRFDAQTIAYLLLPLGLWVLLESIFLNKFLPQTVFLFLQKIILMLYTILAIVCAALWVVEIFYYGFFQSRFNILAFGFVADKHVVQSIQKEFPWWQVALLLTVLAIFFYRVLSNIFSSFRKKKYQWSRKKIWIGTAAVLGSYIFLMRGTLTVFPLHEFNAHISSSNFVNEMCKNPIFCLQNALLEKEASSVNDNYKATPRNFGFGNNETVWRTQLRDTSLEWQGVVPPQIWDTTAANNFLEQHPPNVILLQMESFSTAYMDLHTAQCNTLGELANQLPYCHTYRHCTSMRIGTHVTLDWLLSSALLSNISRSKYYNHSFNGNISKLYQSANYYTSFITGNELGWDNIDRSLSHQNFDNIVGSAELLEKYPSAPLHEYGVHDEVMFEAIIQQLKSNKKPQFIYGMSISNHSPYEVPSSYKILPCNVNSFSSPRKICDDATATKNFIAHQYGADCLGKFLKKLRQSPYANNTIVIATGDHNSKAVLNYGGCNQFMFNSVPLIFYIPQAYQQGDVDTTIFTSHADVLASAVYLSLSRTPYLHFGHSVFKDVQDSSKHFALNFDDRWLATKAGMVTLGSKHQYYEWLHAGSLQVKPTNINIKQLESCIPYSNAFYASSIIYMQHELASQKKMIAPTASPQKK